MVPAICGGRDLRLSSPQQRHSREHVHEHAAGSTWSVIVQTGADRSVHSAQVCRAGADTGRACGRASSRGDGAFLVVWPRGCRAKKTGQGRYDLSHLFDDEADHVDRVHAVGRAGLGRSRRAGAQVHSGLEGPGRVRGRRRHDPFPHEGVRTADAGHRLAAAHVGAHLWVPRDDQRGCRLSQAQDRRDREERNARRYDREACQAAARVFAGHGVELFSVDRHRGLSRREDFGAEVRRLSAYENLQAARHDRYRFPCASG